MLSVNGGTESYGTPEPSRTPGHIGFACSTYKGVPVLVDVLPGSRL